MNQYEKGFEDCKKQVKAAMIAAVENAILMEREACARLCDEHAAEVWDQEGGALNCAEKIRARWQK
jgi:hypothetical protein